VRGDLELRSVALEVKAEAEDLTAFAADGLTPSERFRVVHELQGFDDPHGIRVPPPGRRRVVSRNAPPSSAGAIEARGAGVDHLRPLVLA
jgi:hypothetical protein